MGWGLLIIAVLVFVLFYVFYPRNRGGGHRF